MREEFDIYYFTPKLGLCHARVFELGGHYKSASVDGLLPCGSRFVSKQASYRTREDCIESNIAIYEDSINDKKRDIAALTEEIDSERETLAFLLKLKEGHR